VKLLETISHKQHRFQYKISPIPTTHLYVHRRHYILKRIQPTYPSSQTIRSRKYRFKDCRTTTQEIAKTPPECPTNEYVLGDQLWARLDALTEKNQLNFISVKTNDQLGDMKNPRSQTQCKTKPLRLHPKTFSLSLPRPSAIYQLRTLQEPRRNRNKIFQLFSAFWNRNAT